MELNTGTQRRAAMADSASGLPSGESSEQSGESGQELIDRAHDRSGEVGVTRISDPDQMRGLIADHLAAAHREVCSALPAGPYSLKVLRSSWDEDVAMLTSGVVGMVIYQADAVRTPEMLGYVTDFAAAGATVRVAAGSATG